ncbi:hypothetical protein [Streptomyces jumonjinensis]|uniref:Uncharacterized protein n=1 Tax=Streptomyces jumonjinensis TaxID=1945 RepID=A0A646KMJ2_STRJU|nr:hypothetical protein [Streptomyces jumonjinensis]MQT03161.1 hypothetical protein [Streptomyces jumonjinensis]
MTAPEPLVVDIYAAALATGIRPGTIRLRLHRHRITHHGYDAHGRALVDLAELQTSPPLEREDHERPDDHAVFGGPVVEVGLQRRRAA